MLTGGLALEGSACEFSLDFIPRHLVIIARNGFRKASKDQDDFDDVDTSCNTRTKNQDSNLILNALLGRYRLYIYAAHRAHCDVLYWRHGTDVNVYRWIVHQCLLDQLSQSNTTAFSATDRWHRSLNAKGCRRGHAGDNKLELKRRT